MVATVLLASCREDAADTNLASHTGAATSSGAEASSEPCFNAADDRAGTKLEQEGEAKFSGQPTVRDRSVRATGQPERVGSATASPLITPLSMGEVQVVGNIFVNQVDGNIVHYGNSTLTTLPSSTNLQTITCGPAPVFPVTMQRGVAVVRAFKSSTVTTSTGSGGVATAVEANWIREHTYLGRQTLETKLGRIATCRFTNKMTITDATGVTNVDTIEAWVAAEGPYRGQVLKTHTFGSGGESTYEVTRMVYTPR